MGSQDSPENHPEMAGKITRAHVERKYRADDAPHNAGDEERLHGFALCYTAQRPCRYFVAGRAARGRACEPGENIWPPIDCFVDNLLARGELDPGKNG